MFRLALIAAILAVTALLSLPASPLYPIVQMRTASFWPGKIARFDMRSEITGVDYTILVKVPDGPAPESGWPSLWLTDGLSSFPPLANTPMRDGSPAPGVLIGIEFPSGAAYEPSNRRIALTPIPLGWTPGEGDDFGGAADFRRFLLEELRPKIAAHIPLNPAETTLFGYSLGGLFVIDTLLVAPESFSRYFALSPSIWFGNRSVLRQLRATKALRDYRESGPDGTGTGPMVWVFTGVEEELPINQPDPKIRWELRRDAMLTNSRLALVGLHRLGFDTRHSFPQGYDHGQMLSYALPFIQELAFDPEGLTSQELKAN